MAFSLIAYKYSCFYLNLKNKMKKTDIQFVW